MTRIATKSFGFLLAGILFSSLTYSQDRELDSLLSVIKSAKGDTNKIKTYKRLVFILTDVNADSAKIYLSEMKSLSEKLNYPEGIIYADVKLAEIYNMNGDFGEAMKLNRSNLNFSMQKGTPYQQADVHKTFAMGYSMQEQNDSALFHYLQALRTYENSSDSLNMAKVMVNMAIVHDNMGDHIKAIEYCERSKKIFASKDRNAYLVTLTNLALYQAYAKDFTQSEKNYKEALDLATAQKNFNSLAHIYSGLVDVSYWQKQYAQMLPYARAFEQVAKDMDNGYVILRAKLSMGKAFFFNKQFDEAEKYFKDGLKLSDQLEDNPLLKDIYGMYSYLVLKKYDIEEFAAYRQKIDSLTALENKEFITRNTKELETRYETEKKDSQLKLQASNIRQKQLWNYLLAGAILALCVIGFVSFKGYRNRQQLLRKEKDLADKEITRLQQEKQLSATQAVLQGQDEERSRLAKDLHDGLGGMLSGIKFSFRNMKENMVMTPDNQQAFARNMDMLDGIIQELRRVAHNMMPESLIKFGLDAALLDMVNYIRQTGVLKVEYQSLGVQNLSIDQNIAVNIYRIIQELLNNVIKHSKATEALVQVVYNKGLFSITVEDNGSGFDTAILQGINREKPGMGWMNIKNRIDSMKGNVDIQSSSEKGSSVLIEFNLGEA